MAIQEHVHLAMNHLIPAKLGAGGTAITSTTALALVRRDADTARRRSRRTQTGSHRNSGTLMPVAMPPSPTTQ